MDLFLILIIIALPMLAQGKVKSSYQNFSRIKNSAEISGYEVARLIAEMSAKASSPFDANDLSL